MTEPAHTMADERDERAALWCLRLAEARLDAEERAAFDRWIAADPRNARAFEEAVAIWEGVDAIAHAPEMIRHRAEAVESLRYRNARRWSRGAALRCRCLGTVAAGLAVLVAATVLLLHDGPTRYRTDIGERRVVMLEDGSRLTLDAASAVNVQLDDDRRSLELLAGRARFDVAHDPLRPFSVRAGNRVTVATGTSFSVELLSSQVRVVLYEGRVEVLDHPDDALPPLSLQAPARVEATPVEAAPIQTALVLNPGSELIASTVEPTAQVVKADLTRALSWEAGLLSFEGEPLALAAERMNRHAKNRIVLRDPRVAAYSISGVFAAGDAEAFVEGVTALYPIRVTRAPGELVLASRN